MLLPFAERLESGIALVLYDDKDSKTLTHIHLVSIEVSVVGVTGTLVKTQGSPWSYFNSMTHDGQLVQTGLSVEQYDTKEGSGYVSGKKARNSDS